MPATNPAPAAFPVRKAADNSVLIVSDQPALRRGLSAVLARYGFEILAACTVEEVARSIEGRNSPGVILFDADAGLVSHSLAGLRQLIPDCSVVLLAETLPPEITFCPFEFGVRGIVRRNVRPEQLAQSLREIASGELHMGLGTASDDPVQPASRQVSLSPRERDVLRLIRKGQKNKQIADELGLSPGTVKGYLFRLFQKLGVKSRLELARTAAAIISSEQPAFPSVDRQDAIPA